MDTYGLHNESDGKQCIHLLILLVNHLIRICGPLEHTLGPLDIEENVVSKDPMAS